MSKEALRTQLDALQVDNQWLQAANAKLRDARPEGAARADAEAEIARLSALVCTLQGEAETANRTAEAVENRIQELLETAENQREEIVGLEEGLKRGETEWEQLTIENTKLMEKLDTLSRDKELECLRAVDEERRKSAAREKLLLTQLAEMEGKMLYSRPARGTSAHASTVVVDPAPHTERERTQASEHVSFTHGGEHINTGSSVGVESETHPSTGDFGIGSGPIYQSAFLAHQLPPLAPFKGDVGPNTETIDEWLERFEMLAAECRWTTRAKLLHLTSRLERQAYSFYSSCMPQVKGSFEHLAA